jgi:hypothetical protein
MRPDRQSISLTKMQPSRNIITLQYANNMQLISIYCTTMTYARIAPYDSLCKTNPIQVCRAPLPMLVMCSFGEGWLRPKCRFGKTIPIPPTHNHLLASAIRRHSLLQNEPNSPCPTQSPLPVGVRRPHPSTTEVAMPLSDGVCCPYCRRSALSVLRKVRAHLEAHLCD